MSRMAEEGSARHDGYVEQPERWPNWTHERSGGQRRGPFGSSGPHRWRHHDPVRPAGPFRRDLSGRMGGGLASAVAMRRSVDVKKVRIVFAVLAVVTWGFGVVAYVAGWLLIPAAGADASIGARARSDSKGIRLAVGVASLLVVILLVPGLFGDSFYVSWAWPQVLSVAGLVLIWRNASPEEQGTLQRLMEPLQSAAGPAGPAGKKRRTRIRMAIAFVLLLCGVGALSSAKASTALLKPLGGGLLVIAAIVVFLGPWWVRIARDLVLERQARVRAEERADIAARVHDSVLQTLALIQRRADDPQKVVQLARMQERELRSWLFEGRAPGENDADMTLAAGIRQIQQDVEARYGVPVEAVTVGDCGLDDNLNALLAAAKEATVNAAKWSGASVISLFAEVEAEEVSIVVRDRGRGFDASAVPEDRKGLAESVRGRMTRRGGSAVVNSVPGEGTKITLTMPRPASAPAPTTAPVSRPRRGPDGTRVMSPLDDRSRK